MINKVRRCSTRSDNVYFANNEQASLAFTATICFAHAEHNLIVSATLSGVETLKYPPFYGICFFVEIFSFFNLVSDFFSK